MKKSILSVLFLAAAALGLTGCKTTQITTPVSARVTAAIADGQGALTLALTPILQKNSKYASDAVLIGTTLPTLLQNGPVTTASITAALGQIPGLTAQERQDLAYVAVGLPLVMKEVSDITGMQLVLYTDPNVEAIVTALCGALKSAGQSVPTAAPAPTG